jgi:hypothetical protein
MYTSELYDHAVKNPSSVELLVHDDGIMVPELEGAYRTRLAHDPSNLDAARRLAEDGERIRIGVFFRDEVRRVYEETRWPVEISATQRVALLNAELDKYAV